MSRPGYPKMMSDVAIHTATLLGSTSEAHGRPQVEHSSLYEDRVTILAI